LQQAQRDHVRSQRRSVTREAPQFSGLSAASAAELADRLFVADRTPVGRLQREELLARVREALEQLSERDREVLILRYLEQLSTRDTAAVLGIGESAVKMRHLRAVQHCGNFSTCTL
jgi:RNA polymerase sigma factor (sigma-70 family)